VAPLLLVPNIFKKGIENSKDDKKDDIKDHHIA